MCVIALAVLAILGIYCSDRRILYTSSHLSPAQPARRVHRPLARASTTTRKVRHARETRPAGFTSSRRLSAEDIGRSSHPNPPSNDHRLSLAIVRTISPTDDKALVESFSAWIDHRLGQKCQGKGYYNADLIISFSQILDDDKYPDIRKAIEAVRSLHKKTGGWGGCIRSIQTFEAEIPADEDLYDPSIIEAGNSSWQNWVNGPNR